MNKPIFRKNRPSKMKVFIYTVAFNRPDLIELQLRSMNAFIKDEFEFIVVNNTMNTDAYIANINECARLNIRCEYVINPDNRNPNVSHAFAVQQIVDRFITRERDCISVIIDSDMFFIEPINLNKYMKLYDFAGVEQARVTENKDLVKYIGISLVFIDHSTIPDQLDRLRELNLRCGYIHGAPCDGGGMSYHYFNEYPDTKIKWMMPIPLYPIPNTEPLDYTKFLGEASDGYKETFESEVIDDFIFHARKASNWDGSDSVGKTSFLKELINSKIQAYDKVSK